MATRLKLKTELQALETLMSVANPKGMLPRMVVRKRHNSAKKHNPRKSYTAHLEVASEVRKHLLKDLKFFAESPRKRFAK